MGLTLLNAGLVLVLFFNPCKISMRRLLDRHLFKGRSKAEDLTMKCRRLLSRDILRHCSVLLLMFQLRKALQQQPSYPAEKDHKTEK